jgi:hypothetical protein
MSVEVLRQTSGAAKESSRRSSREVEEGPIESLELSGLGSGSDAKKQPVFRGVLRLRWPMLGSEVNVLVCSLEDFNCIEEKGWTQVTKYNGGSKMLTIIFLSTGLI